MPKCSVRTKTWFNYVWDELFVGNWVGVFQSFATNFLVTAKVVVGAVSNTPKFAPTKWELNFKVGCRLGVEAQFILIVVA